MLRTFPIPAAIFSAGFVLIAIGVTMAFGWAGALIAAGAICVLAACILVT